MRKTEPPPTRRVIAQDGRFTLLSAFSFESRSTRAGRRHSAGIWQQRRMQHLFATTILQTRVAE